MQAPRSTSLHVPDLLRQEGVVCTSVLCAYMNNLCKRMSTLADELKTVCVHTCVCVCACPCVRVQREDDALFLEKNTTDPTP